MWLVIKLIMAGVGFAVRLLARNHSLFGGQSTELVVDGLDCEVVVQSHKGKVHSTLFGFEFERPVIFKLSKEKWIDQAFKFLGIADEIQTGDQSFDKQIYVASDNEAFKEELREDSTSRKLILELFEKGCGSITCNGKMTWFRFKEDRSSQLDLAKTCAQLHRQVSDFGRNPKSLFSDPFAMKVLLTESVIWSLAAYAATSFFEGVYLKEQDLHLDHYPILRQGLWLGALLALALFLAIVFFLKGSSRGHRILVESFLVLGLSLPAGGLSLISDLNTHFDQSFPVVLDATVTDLYPQQHRGRRGRTWYTYHLYIDLKDEFSEFSIPRHIQISRSLYGRLNKGGSVKLEIGRGRLKHPWFRSIEPQY